MKILYVEIGVTNIRQHHLLVITAIVCVALNLRPALAAIGPLLDMIEAATGSSYTQVSLLTTLPVLVMGICALGGRQINDWLSERRGIGLGVALILTACAARSVFVGTGGLLLTATMAGIGIGLVQTLIPAFVKRRFAANAGRVFALYTTGIMGGAAIAAASSGGLAELLGWSSALVLWAAPALIALPLWLHATRKGASPEAAVADTIRPASRAFWRNLRAWELMTFFGIGTGAYTLVLAWLPPFYTSLGWQPSKAGLLLGWLTLTEVLAGLAISAWVGRFSDRRILLVVVLVTLIVGLACLIIAPLSLALLASVLLGAGIGALFPLSLILTLDHIDEPTQAGMLLAFVQGGGYIIASFMPLLAGVLRDQFANVAHAWIAMLIGAMFLLLLCLRFSPASYGKING